MYYPTSLAQATVTISTCSSMTSGPSRDVAILARDASRCSSLFLLLLRRLCSIRTLALALALVLCILELRGGLVERVVDDALEVRERGLEATMCAKKEKEDGRRTGSNTG